MTLAFWDSSAFVKLLIDEIGSEAAERLWNDPGHTAASRLVVPEVSAALAAARRAGRLDHRSHDQAQRQWRSYRAEINFVEVTAQLAEHAEVLAVEHDLSGADAVHLASALAYADVDVMLVAWDARLRAAAAELGLTVTPDQRR